MPSSEIDRLKQDRERLRREHAAGASGLFVARSLAESTDTAIRSIWDNLGSAPGSALVALGGYGRGLLSPASDIDVIVLHHKRTQVVPHAKALAYELWDAGLELGYAIYTPKEAMRLSKSRLDSETAFLDARLLTGDRELFEEWTSEALYKTRRSRDFVQKLETATSLRRAKAGDAGAELEPNLKEGRGGLRDLAAIGWLARVIGERFEDERIEEASDYLFRVRNELHFSTGRRTDVLSMQHQVSVAPALVGERGDVAREDVLMRTLYGHCRVVAYTLDVMFDRLLESRNSEWRRDLPKQPLGDSRWEESSRSAFIKVLRDADLVRSAFEEMEQTGLLTQLIPEWEGIRCLPQRNVYHRYAVDIHSIEAASAASSLRESKDELVAAVAAEVALGSADENALLLSALLHDIGKGGVQDHAVQGEALAKAVIDRIGMSGEDAGDIVWLVRHHLLLAETATRRDIGDERLIVEIADKVGTERRLRLLFLLTVADAVATGAAGWTPWKATLVSRLFTRVTHVMEKGGLAGGAAAPIAHERIEELRRALVEFPETQVSAHLENMPRQWLLSHPLPSLITQSALMLEPLETDQVRLRAVPEALAGIWEITVVAGDRPGLFSNVAGSLALHGLNVAGAEIYTREDGLALEIFRVEALGDEEHRFQRVEEDARKAIRGRLSLDVRLAEKRKDYSGRFPKGKQEPPQVVLDNRSSDFFTVIEVHAPDRVGLLFTITRALTDLGLDIQLAKIATYAEDVIDVFYVRDLEGQKIEDAEHVREIERTILFRLASEH